MHGDITAPPKENGTGQLPKGSGSTKNLQKGQNVYATGDEKGRRRVLPHFAQAARRSDPRWAPPDDSGSRRVCARGDRSVVSDYPRRDSGRTWRPMPQAIQRGARPGALEHTQV